MPRADARRVDILQERLRDARGRRVVFLSHCLLNQNTRYLGGACRSCCVQEIVEQCVVKGIGMVQLPCPEEHVWGGVLKRHMLRLYGAPALGSPFWRAAWLYTRLRYRVIARQAAAQIADYLRSGFSVLGVVGVDGSPSCGVQKTVDGGAFVADLASVDPRSFSVARQNALVRRHATAGRGLFIQELARELGRRGVEVPFLAHDLFDELAGRKSELTLPAGDAHP
jgi:predicted secreted protein